MRKAYFTLLFLFFLGCASSDKMENLPGYAVMQGGTDSTSTQIVVLHPKKEQLKYRILNTSSNKEVKEVTKKQISREHSPWALTRIGLKKLNPLSRYQIEFLGQENQVIDRRQFKTIESRLDLKWAVASCMNDSFMNAQKQQWLDLVSHKPQVLFMIGDNVYADSKTKMVTPEVLWSRHAETRSRLEIFRQPRLVPVFATWDDHDYGVNNGGRSFPYKEEFKAIFEDFFPQPVSKIMEHGPGVAKSLLLGRQSFLFLDNRSFRTSRHLKKDQSHFGAKQEQWIYKQIEKAQGPVWLISGDQFFGGYHAFESYQGNHPRSFKKFLRKIKSTGKKVAFVSGDRHLSEIMRLPKRYLGYVSFELTSSGIHSSVFPGSFKRNPNPLDIEAVDGTMNYMIVESRAQKKNLRFKATSFGPDKKVLFSRSLRVR